MMDRTTTPALAERLRARFRAAFGRVAQVGARAPGRVEVIGNHTDYNGGLVIGASIDREIASAAAIRVDRDLRIVSGRGSVVEASLDDLVPRGGEERWANYPIGVILMLIRADVPVDRGFEIAFESSLPTGAGLSSSAAIELATAHSVLQLFGQSLEPNELVRICRRAENLFVGVPSGLLDQGVSHFGRPGHVVLVDSRMETFQGYPLPGRLRFWIFNSHRKHALVASLYKQRHQECMDARAALGTLRGEIEHLTDLGPEEVGASQKAMDRTLFKRALHIVSEHRRVQEAISALEHGDPRRLGQAMYASHASSRDLFENSTPELDFLVDALSRRNHVVGARLTGGGFGGAVLALTTSAFSETDAISVADAYRQHFGAPVEVMACETAEGSGALDLSPSSGR